MPAFRWSDALAFVSLCVIWGSTWIAIKAGVDVVPPLLFGSTRFMAAGLLLLALAKLRDEHLRVERSDMLRLTAASLLMISLCYGPLFWGMQYIDSGSAALLELSLTPVALLIFALILREERWNWKRGASIGLGVAGLFILFAPDVLEGQEAAEGVSAVWTVLGGSAVAVAAFTYGLGSVIARPLLRIYPPFLVAGLTTLIGGALLFVFALIFEAGALEALNGEWGLGPWIGWLFLVIFGSIVGYTVYMRLLRDVGASRSGSYAFVSPIIAVILGALVFSEPVDLLDIVAMFVMLSAAYLAMFRTGQDIE